jgi:hypothetical protein
MVKTTIEIDDELWEDFRRKVRIKFGGVYGNINKAIIDAIKRWCKET